jgi:hypothetical protein
MDVLISLLAVVVALACFGAIMTAEWRENKKRSAARIESAESQNRR